MNSKSKIRKEYLTKRRNLSKEFVNSASEKISKRAIEYFSENDFKNIILYADFDNEPKTDSLKRFFAEKEITVAYPLIKEDIIIAKIPQNEMTIGAFGILEPAENSPAIKPEELDLIIIPGIAFDKNKNRIGYGKGFYDKFLSKTKALKAALSYDFQIYNGMFETDSYDVPMDLIITEKEILN